MTLLTAIGIGIGVGFILKKVHYFWTESEKYIPKKEEKPEHPAVNLAKRESELMEEMAVKESDKNEAMQKVKDAMKKAQEAAEIESDSEESHLVSPKQDEKPLAPAVKKR